MKRIITSTLFALCCIILSAENISLTLNVTPGELKNQLTEEQMNTVTDLILTGAMNDEDFYTIRDNMKKLTYLDMKEVQVDTIPVKALNSNGKFDLERVILPKSVKYLKDNAFGEYYNCQFVLTGKFPKRGKDVFGGWSARMAVSNDNMFCKQIRESIYSMDETILYFYNPASFIDSIANGTKKIAEKAFEYKYINTVIFPPTLDHIESEAFYGVRGLIPTRISDYDCLIIMKSKNPPTLEGNVFEDNFEVTIGFLLYVPFGSANIYKSTKQWSNFTQIYEGNPYSSNISNFKINRLSISKSNNSISLSSDLNIKKINIINLSGQTIYSKEINSNQWMINENDIPKEISLIKATFDNGESETIKWMNE